MPRAAVELHPEARAEYLAAITWYVERSPDAALRFSSEVDRAVELIAEAPRRWPSHLDGTRRVLLRRFPVQRRLPSDARKPVRGRHRASPTSARVLEESSLPLSHEPARAGASPRLKKKGR